MDWVKRNSNQATKTITNEKATPLQRIRLANCCKLSMDCVSSANASEPNPSVIKKYKNTKHIISPINVDDEEH